jgi:flagellar motor component MotA
MPKPRQDPKSTALKNDAVLNPHPGAVTDALFQSNAFFDARDLVQVKYEMLRRARAEGMLRISDQGDRGFRSNVTDDSD